MEMTLPNKLDDKAGSDDVLSVKYSVESMEDFTPDAIVEKVPELKNMIALRDALKALKGPLGNIPDFRKELQELIKDEGVRQRLLAELGIQDK
jgi:type VI secretion system protein ImpB